MSQDRDWVTPCHRYALQLTTASWQQIDKECGRSGTIETGGILVGYYSADASTVIVTEAFPPPEDSTCGRSWFHRGVVGLSELLTKRWQSKFRSYYVGEWHYHPATTVEPSKDDLAQMYSINADRQYSCREPVMLIAGRPQDSQERSLRAFVFPQGQKHIELKEYSSHGKR